VRLKQKVTNDKRIGLEVVENLKKFRYSDSKRGQHAQLIRISLPNANVLIVDDTIMNLDVAKGLMKPYGMLIDCVTSGQEAVDAIKAEKVKYNAIFMDHMMPGMDGIEAAELIRGLDSEYAKTVPIIALTANAIIGNEKMFLEKGFDAFLSKPINILQLDSVIKKWIENNSQTAANKEASALHSNGASPGQLPGLDMKAGLALYGGDMEILKFAIESFIAHTPEIIAELQNPTEEGLQNYAIHIHSLKSSFAAIGAEELRERARQLEMISKAGDLSGVLAANGDLLKDTDVFTSNAKTWLAKFGN
jgi:CheY-like chemotaxis protein